MKGTWPLLICAQGLPRKFRVFTCIAAFLTLVMGCTTEPTVDVFLTGIAPAQSTLFEPRIRVDLRVQNLTNQPLRASGMQLQIDVNGRRLARGVSNNAFSIERLAEAPTSIVLSSSLFATVGQLFGLADNRPIEYALKGTLYTDGARKRFKRTGTFSHQGAQVLDVQTP